MTNESMRFTRRTLGHGAAALALLLAATPARAEGAAVEAVPGKPTLQLAAYDLATIGYRSEEFFVTGTASSYKLAAEATEDGRWSASVAITAPYATRFLVVRPMDPKKFSGTVLVEWMNVSAGFDGVPDWLMGHREIARKGHVLVAVSAQKVGIEGGGGVMGMGGQSVKQANPERYGRLNHPGDEYSFDIFSQVGRLVRSDAAKILGGLAPKHVIAMGESQSAAFLTTYVNAVDPLAKVYDGIMVHSRFGSGAGLGGGGMAGGMPKYVKFRPDLRVPLLVLETETDLLDGSGARSLSGYNGARVPDNNKLRVWEVAGTAHADAYTFFLSQYDNGTMPIEKLAAGYAPMSELRGMKLEKPVNAAPQHHYMVQSAIAHLVDWVSSGKAPPKAPGPIVHTGAEGAPFTVDANGNAQGGIRTPWVDVPVARLSGVPKSGGPLGGLAGYTEPFDAATLKKLYPGGKSDYLKKFEASLDKTIKAGFLLPADKKEILDIAAAAYPAS